MEICESLVHGRSTVERQNDKPVTVRTDALETRAGRYFGYARVSSSDQNLARQLAALSEWDIDKKNLFTDKASGKDFDRPAYRRMLKRLKQGDILVVKSIDRLGRDYEEILKEWRYLVKEKKCHIVVLDMPLLDTRSPISGITGTLLTDILLELFSYVAHIERENTKTRQAEGIAAAKANGVRFGRPLKKPENWSRLRNQMVLGVLKKTEVARELNVDVSTVYRWIREDSRHEAANCRAVSTR